MASPFKTAKRQGRKLRIAFDGPSGSGKSYTMLRLLFSMKAAGLVNKIAIIDTENESVSLYEGESPDGDRWEFDVLNLKQFSPQQFTAAMKEAVKYGYDGIGVDSLSHAWIGEGGALDQVDKRSTAGANSFTAWKDITPMQREMMDTIIRLPAHVAVTMRSKTEYVMEEQTNREGKKITVPRKIGMAPVQRDGMEYEFDVYGSMDWSNFIRVTKSRCSPLQGKMTERPGPTFWKPLFDWLNSSEASVESPAVVTSSEDAPVAVVAEKTALEESADETVARWKTTISASTTLGDLKSHGEKITVECSGLTEEKKKEVREEYVKKQKHLIANPPSPTA
jgi:hypothetical protein